jgi:hypothetical protein
VGAELFNAGGQTQKNRQTDRQTDVTKLTVAFRNFANALKTKFSGRALCHLGRETVKCVALFYCDFARVPWRRRLQS